MRKIGFFISVVLLFSSCLKKIDGVDQLNTNIYDKEYAGDSWFIIDDMVGFLVDGQLRYKMKILIPKENLPNLKPTFIDVNCQVNSQDFGVNQAVLKTTGDYKLDLVVVPDGGTEYCITMGIYVQEEDVTINSFTECTNI